MDILNHEAKQKIYGINLAEVREGMLISSFFVGDNQQINFKLKQF